MAKKTPNQSPEQNLLSKRMKKTDHGDKKGRYSQQAEINIFVQDEQSHNPNNQPFIPQYGEPPTQPNNTFNGNQNPQFGNQPQYQDVYQGDNQTPIYEQPQTYAEPTFDIPQQTQQPQQPTGNSFRDRFQKQEPPAQNQPRVQEFTFNSDDEYVDETTQSTEMQFDERYTNMFRDNQKKKTEKRPKRTYAVGENALNGKDGNPFKKKMSKKARIIVLVSCIVTALLIPQLIFRIPALIDVKDDMMLELNVSGKQTITDYIKIQNGVADWDKDGITNASDNDVFDPDANRDGIPDGMESKDFLDIGGVMKYENVTLEIQNEKMGVSKFLNYYVFKNYKGWVKISNETGVPYIYQSNGWTEAEYTVEGGEYMIKVPKDCMIEFTPKGTKPVYRTDFLGDKTFATEESRYVKSYGGFAPVLSVLLKSFLPVTEPTDASIASIWHTDTYHIINQNNIHKAEAVQPPKDNYKITILNDYEFTYDKLYKIYDNIDDKKTTLISIIREDGSEAICFAYAYDYLGNIYLADAQTSKTAGVMKVTPMCQVYHKDGQNYIREWYEFEGLGFSSADGDKLFVY